MCISISGKKIMGVSPPFLMRAIKQIYYLGYILFFLLRKKESGGTSSFFFPHYN